MTRRLLPAVAFLTRFPVAGRVELGAADVGRASVFFPLVGAGLGVGSVLFLKLFSLRIDASGGVSLGAPWLPAFLLAIGVVGFSAWMTGAIHLDGLADMADGFGGARTRERVLEIMRDPRLGAFGGLALILVLLAKVGTTGILLERGEAVGYLIAAPTLARWSSVTLGWFLPYARLERGLGDAIAGSVRWKELAGATGIAAAVTGMVSGRRGLACWLVVSGVTWVMGRWCRRRIGGVTGDTLGASIELSETAVLVTAVGLTG